MYFSADFLNYRASKKDGLLEFNDKLETEIGEVNFQYWTFNSNSVYFNIIPKL